MKDYRILSSVFLTTLVMISSGFSWTGDELSKYKETELIAPDFSLKSLDGNIYKLSNYRGKIVVLEMGSST
ncbi:peroxiredoxin family protein [Acidobacteria bacterium AH-259-D05]|nr:peroxiredoxin family protein [Acidobacteria bacterium AH-259-D05]